MKDVYVLSCYTKLPCQDDLIEVFDNKEEALEALEVISQFGEKLANGYKLRHPIIDCGYIVDRLIKEVPMLDEAYEKMVEYNNRLLSSASVDNYWHDYITFGKSSEPLIKDYIPYEFM